MIEALSVQFAVKESCAALSVSRSGSYQWVGTEQSKKRLGENKSSLKQRGNEKEGET
jgi:hypothetical protein